MTDQEHEPQRSDGDGGASNDGTVSWGELLAEAVATFRRNGTEDPAGSARRIVEEATGFQPMELSLNLRHKASVRGVAKLDAMVARRLKGEPLQYVVGSWGFRTLDLAVDKRVLIPRPETEEVVGWGLVELERATSEDADGFDPLVADLGTGSGAIGLSVLAEVANAQVWLSDASSQALAMARANLVALGRPGVRGRIVEGSWFEALPDALIGQLSLVISNPPYVATSDSLPSVVADWEPNQALVSGPSGTEDVEHLLSEAPKWLRPKGAFVVEMAPSQVNQMAEYAGQFFAQVETRTDLSGRQRAVIARHPNGS